MIRLGVFLIQKRIFFCQILSVSKILGEIVKIIIHQNHNKNVNTMEKNKGSNFNSEFFCLNFFKSMAFQRPKVGSFCVKLILDFNLEHVKWFYSDTCTPRRAFENVYISLNFVDCHRF